jgi:hypothetical protein
MNTVADVADFWTYLSFASADAKAMADGPYFSGMLSQLTWSFTVWRRMGYGSSTKEKEEDYDEHSKVR